MRQACQDGEPASAWLVRYLDSGSPIWAALRRQRAARHNARMGLPTGTVTMLFSDMEGSTRLLARLGATYGDLLSAQRRLLRSAFGASPVLALR